MYEIMGLIGRGILILIVLAVAVALVDAWRIVTIERRRRKQSRYLAGRRGK